jgi:hypothetical protein
VSGGAAHAGHGGGEHVPGEGQHLGLVLPRLAVAQCDPARGGVGAHAEALAFQFVLGGEVGVELAVAGGGGGLSLAYPLGALGLGELPVVAGQQTRPTVISAPSGATTRKQRARVRPQWSQVASPLVMPVSCQVVVVMTGTLAFLLSGVQ